MNSRAKFDLAEKPRKSPFYIRWLMWFLTQVYTIPVGAKVEKINCEGLEHPYLLLQNHASFVDFAVACRATNYKPVNWVISIEEFNKREWLMRSIGGIYKRKFTKDITVVKHILTAIKERTVVIYPEARFSLIGTDDRLDGALGKLVKKAKVPVVTIIQNGNFLRSPQWDKHPYRDVHVEAYMEQIVTREEVETLSAEEIDKRIAEKFNYSDYQWQFDNKIKIKSKYRANKIHKVLYQCPCCKKEYTMESKFSKLWCNECGAEWEMDYYGVLRHKKDSSFDRMVPEWFNWQRENVRAEVLSGEYNFKDEVRIEHLPCSHDGFVHFADGVLTHNREGFVLRGKTLEGEDFELIRPVSTMHSCHIEYDYKHRGDALELCNLSDTYFVYPKNYDNVITKLHFATQELFDAENQ